MYMYIYIYVYIYSYIYIYTNVLYIYIYIYIYIYYIYVCIYIYNKGCAVGVLQTTKYYAFWYIQPCVRRWRDRQGLWRCKWNSTAGCIKAKLKIKIWRGRSQDKFLLYLGGRGTGVESNSQIWKNLSIYRCIFNFYSFSKIITPLKIFYGLNTI